MTDELTSNFVENGMQSVSDNNSIREGQVFLMLVLRA